MRDQMNTLELFERKNYPGWPDGHATCGPSECFVAGRNANVSWAQSRPRARRQRTFAG